MYARLQKGRPYSSNVPTGLVQGRRGGLAGELGYALEIPENYDSGRKYQVRIQLHGGVGRAANATRRPAGIGRLAGAEQIYILPQAWNEAPWWSDVQLENLRAILDIVKRTYNVEREPRGRLRRVRRRHRRLLRCDARPDALRIVPVAQWVPARSGE